MTLDGTAVQRGDLGVLEENQKTTKKIRWSNGLAKSLTTRSAELQSLCGFRQL